MTSHSDITKRTPMPMQVWSKRNTEVALILEVEGDIVTYRKLAGLHKGDTFSTCMFSFCHLYIPLF